MANTSAGCSESVRHLSPNVCAEVLSEAVARRSPVSMHCEAGASRGAYAGLMAGETAEHLILELENLDANGRESLASFPVDVSFLVGTARYAFTSRGTTEATGISSTAVRVAKPDTLVRTERRRSPRRCLREPARVGIRHGDVSRADEIRGSLLNLSLHGLACRIPSPAVAAFAIDEILHVSFDLGQQMPGLDLTARVTNITEGSSSDQVILGFEFLPAQMSDSSRRRLLQALAETDPKP